MSCVQPLLKNSGVPTFEKLHVQFNWCTQKRSVHCLSERVWPLFLYYSLYNGRGFFHSDGCVSSTHGCPPDLYFTHGRKPKLMSVPTFRFNQRSPCRDAIEVGWKTVVSLELAGALKVLGHCKSRECSNLSRFQRHWSSTGRLIIEHQFINISHESLKIYIWRLSTDIS